MSCHPRFRPLGGADLSGIHFHTQISASGYSYSDYDYDYDYSYSSLYPRHSTLTLTVDVAVTPVLFIFLFCDVHSSTLWRFGNDSLLYTGRPGRNDVGGCGSSSVRSVDGCFVASPSPSPLRCSSARSHCTGSGRCGVAGVIGGSSTSLGRDALLRTAKGCVVIATWDSMTDFSGGGRVLGAHHGTFARLFLATRSDFSVATTVIGTKVTKATKATKVTKATSSRRRTRSERLRQPVCRPGALMVQ